MARRLYALLCLGLALWCSAAIVLPSSRANAQGTEAIRQLERRMDGFDGQHLGERLARMEAQIEALKGQGDTTNKLLLGVCTSLVIMLVERALSAGRRRSSAATRLFEAEE